MRTPAKLLICLALLLLLAPIGYMFITALIGLDTNFLLDVITNSRYLILFSRTVLIAALTALGSIILGVPLAFILARFRIPLSRTLEYLLLLPILIPSYFVTIAWVYMLGWNGLLTVWLQNTLGITTLPFNIYGITGAVFIMVMCHFPFVAFLTLAGLRNLDSNLERTAWLTASRFRAFFRVSLPLVLPYILGGAILVFVLAVNNFDVPSITMLDVYPLEVFYRFSVFFRTDQAMILTLPLLAITLGAVLMWYYLFRNRPIFTINTRWKTPEKIPISWPAQTLCLVFITLILGLAVALPIIGLALNINSFTDIINTFIIIQPHLFNSISTAFISTAGALLLGFLLAYLLERTEFRFKGLLLGLLILSLVIPGSAIGIGLIKLYNHSGLLFIYHSQFIISLGLMARFVALPALIMAGAFKTLDPSLENAAKVSGVSRLDTLTKVILPLLKRPLVISAIICFILAINELAVTILVAPPGITQLSVRIYSLFHFNKAAEVASMCLIMAFLIVLLYIILGSVISKDKGD